MTDAAQRPRLRRADYERLAPFLVEAIAKALSAVGASSTLSAPGLSGVSRRAMRWQGNRDHDTPRRAGPVMAIVALFFFLSACAGPQALLCAPPQQSAVVAELLFGRNIGGRLGVSERDWRAFLAREVTPRFPDGLTVVDASGQWRDSERGRIVREPSKVVTIILRKAVGYRQRIDAIVAAYKRRFRQQSVGVVTRPACVAF